MRTHVDVKATEVPGSKHQTLGNRARVAASNAKGALGKAGGGIGKGLGSVAKGVGGKVAPGLGINGRGEVDFGLRAGGFGVSGSASGRIRVSVPGVDITWKPGERDDWDVELGLGLWTQSSTKDGCTVTITTSFMGKVVNVQTRESDDCRKPEPTPKPEPDPSPDPSNIPAPPPPGGKSTTTTRSLKGELEPGKSYYLTWEGSVISSNPDGSNSIWHYDFGKRGYESEKVIITDDWYVYESTWEGGWDKEYNWREAIAYPNIEVDRTEILKYRAKEVFTVYFRPNPDSDSLGLDYQRVAAFPSNLEFRDSFAYVWRLSSPSGFEDWETNEIGYIGSFKFNDVKPGLTTISQITHIQLVEIGYLPPRIGNIPAARSVPAMNDECDCELLEDIYEMLGGDEFYKNGLTLPNSLYIPGGAGDTKAETYNGLINLLFRTLAYRTPGNIEVKLKDSNIMKPGQQPLTYKPTDATSYYNKLMEVSMSQDSDLSALLNLLVRLNWIAVQILNLTTKINYSTKALLGFFGVPTREKIENVDIPVDPSLGEAVGFENKKPNIDEIIKKLDKDDPKETRNILDKFMNATKIPVVIKSLVSTAQRGNYWWLLDKNKR